MYWVAVLQHAFVLVRIRLTRTAAERGPVLSGACRPGHDLRQNVVLTPLVGRGNPWKMGTGVNGTYLLLCCEQSQPLCRGQSLRAAHRVEAGCCYGFAVENGAELFAPFAKDALYELGEWLPWVAWSLSRA